MVLEQMWEARPTATAPSGGRTEAAGSRGPPEGAAEGGGEDARPDASGPPNSALPSEAPAGGRHSVLSRAALKKAGEWLVAATEAGAAGCIGGVAAAEGAHTNVRKAKKKRRQRVLVHQILDSIRRPLFVG
jgi:hypothetical protein